MEDVDIDAQVELEKLYVNDCGASAKLANVFSWVDNQNILKSIDHENRNHVNLENCIPT